MPEEDDSSGWALTESDPQVFTQLLRDLGVKGLQVVRAGFQLNKPFNENHDLLTILTVLLRMICIHWMLPHLRAFVRRWDD